MNIFADRPAKPKPVSIALLIKCTYMPCTDPKTPCLLTKLSSVCLCRWLCMISSYSYTPCFQHSYGFSSVINEEKLKRMKWNPFPPARTSPPECCQRMPHRSKGNFPISEPSSISNVVALTKTWLNSFASSLRVAIEYCKNFRRTDPEVDWVME